jgi:hypothetical protein
MTGRKPVFETSISDWRLSDGVGNDLVGTQDIPWSVKLLPGPYSGFDLEFHSPDGAVRNINIELDQGNVRLAISTARDDDPIILLAIEPKAIHIAPMNALDGWRFDDKGYAKTDDMPKPSFTENSAHLRLAAERRRKEE